jgi:hypothetical protein
MLVALGQYGHQPMQMPQLQLWRSLDYRNEEFSKYFMTINFIHTTTRGAIVLYGCEFAIGYDIHTLRATSFYLIFSGETKHVLHVTVYSASTAATSGHGMILVLPRNVGMKSASVSASAFGLYN